MIKHLMTFLLVWAPSLAFAQQPGNFDPEMMRRMQDPAAMQEMAAQAKAAQKCMESIDRTKVDALQKRAEAASKEIDGLCAAGKKKEALARGLTLSREMRSDATVKKLRDCTAGMSEMMQGMIPSGLPGMNDEPDPTDSDICD